MIKNRFLRLGLITVLIVAFASCDNVIFDKPVIDNRPEPVVYLSVQSGTSSSFRGALRSSPDQPYGPSINSDMDDYEDWVHSLAMLVFDSGSGDLVVSYFDDGGSNHQIKSWFTVKLTPGTRDFYFVANMPMGDISSIDNSNDMDNYLEQANALDEDLYHAAIDSKGFPMARVYKNQDISEGGTIYNPKPFKPTVNSVEKDRVELIRAVAQLQVTFDADEVAAVDKVYYRNGFKNFTLNPFNTPLDAADVSYYEDATGIELQKDGNSFYFYMPEALIDSFSPVWVSNSTDNKPINYFEILTTAGTIYKIPIITFTFDTTNPYPGGNYITFARGEQTDKPDYNVYRNHRYRYQIKNMISEIEIVYDVRDWEVVETELFMGYGFNVYVKREGSSATVWVENTIDACDPHVIELKALNGAKFDDGDTEKLFTEKANFASEEFKLIDIPSNTKYFEVWYNDYSETSFRSSN